MLGLIIPEKAKRKLNIWMEQSRNLEINWKERFMTRGRERSTVRITNVQNFEMDSFRIPRKSTYENFQRFQDI